MVKELELMKTEIENTIDQIQKSKSTQRKRQLLKHKHRLEKEVMTYMWLRYGIKMRKE